MEMIRIAINEAMTVMKKDENTLLEFGKSTQTVIDKILLIPFGVDSSVKVFQMYQVLRDLMKQMTDHTTQAFM
jgi:hypothetical protein